MQVNATVTLTNGKKRAYVVADDAKITWLAPGKQVTLDVGGSYGIYGNVKDACLALRLVIDGVGT